MRLILNVSNPFQYDGFAYAFVDLTPELARNILARRDVFQALKATDPPLTNLEYHDNSASFLYGLPDDATTDNCDAGSAFDETELPATDFEPLAERTDCDRMVITDGAVYWTAYPKHSDQPIETGMISYETVQAAANVPQEAPEPELCVLAGQRYETIMEWLSTRK